MAAYAPIITIRVRPVGRAAIRAYVPSHAAKAVPSRFARMVDRLNDRIETWLGREPWLSTGVGRIGHTAL